MLVGLTGGIGSGKSLVSDTLAARGIVVIDADQIARALVSPQAPTLHRLAQAFGADIVRPDGHLDRALLRQRAFASDGNRERLNAIMHPAIRSALLAAIGKPRRHGEGSYRILSAPLLFENRLDTLVDVLVVVDVEETLQQQRAAARDGVDMQAIAGIMRGQWTRAQRLAFAHAVIDNHGTREQTMLEVECLHRQLTALAG